jgi:hypothetical protein
MKYAVKFVILVILAGGLVFARSENKNSKVSQKKVKSDYYVIKKHFESKDNNQLDRTRVHKRRRKIRKPIKGLR